MTWEAREERLSAPPMVYAGKGVKQPRGSNLPALEILIVGGLLPD